MIDYTVYIGYQVANWYLNLMGPRKKIINVYLMLVIQGLEMKTSLVLFIIVMLLTGCSVNDQADDIDNIDFNVSDTLKFNSNGPKGGFSEIFPIDGYENNYYYKIYIDEKKMDTPNGYVLYRLIDGEPTIINDDVSTVCNFQTFEKCSGFLGSNSVSFFYNDKFYIVSDEIEPSSDIRKTTIYEANSNLGNVKEIYGFNSIVLYDVEYTPTTYYFHDHQMIIMHSNKIVSLDLNTKQEEVLFDQEQVNIYFSTIHDDTLYFQAFDYLDDSQALVKHINLSINLANGELRDAFYNLNEYGNTPNIILVTDDYVLFYISENDNYLLKSYEIESGEVYDIDKFGYLSYNEYFDKNSFIISQVPNDEGLDDTMLYSFTGEKIDSFKKSNESFLGGILTNDGSYLSAKDVMNNTTIYSRNISKGKFAKRKIFNELQVGK